MFSSRKKKSTVDVLKEHSVAKVNLYTAYLGRYLRILGRTHFVRRIFVFDLFCGEGMYADDSLGSAVEAAKAIHLAMSEPEFKPKIKYVINDTGKSKIEPSKYKVDRVAELIDDLLPTGVLEVRREEYATLTPKISTFLSKFDSAQKALLFIDPYGYKDIKPDSIKMLLSSGHVEVLLFSPVHFIYRFAESKRRLRGLEPVQELIQALFPDTRPDRSSVGKFIKSLKQAWSKYTGAYCEVFYLQTEDDLTYAIFFFTKNEIGWKKFIDSMCEVSETGSGHRKEKAMLMFGSEETDNFQHSLLKHIKESGQMGLPVLIDYGYANGYSESKTKKMLAKCLQAGLLHAYETQGKRFKLPPSSRLKKELMFQSNG